MEVSSLCLVSGAKILKAAAQVVFGLTFYTFMGNNNIREAKDRTGNVNQTISVNSTR